LVTAWAEGCRNRVWEGRQRVGGDVIGGRDIGTYRLAEARLRVLSREPKLLAAVEALHKSGTALGKAWRLGSNNEAMVDSAWAAHRDAVDRFIAVSSQMIPRRPAINHRRQHVDSANQ